MRATWDMRVWFILKRSTKGPVMRSGRTVPLVDDERDGEGGGLGSWGTGGTCGTTMSAFALSMVVSKSVKPSEYGAVGRGSDGEPDRDGSVHDDVVDETEDWRPRAQVRVGWGCLVSGDWQRAT